MTKEVINRETVENTDKRKWYQEGLVQSLLALITFGSAVSIFYEGFRIPLVIHDKEKQISELTNELSTWKSNSELAKTQTQNNSLKVLLDSKEKQIKALESNIKEINISREKLNQQLFNYDKTNKDWVSLNNKRSAELESYKSSLSSCQNDLELKKEITALRIKIEDNNRYISRNDIYRPNDTQIQTYREDNKNLNRMIENYQQKLHCQN